MNEAKAYASSWAWLLAITLAGLSGAVLFLFDPSQYSFYPVCVFHQLTGLQCPGCGTLRAAHQLLHGNLASAWHFNALFVVGLALLGGWGLKLGWRAVHGRPATGRGMRGLWIWCALGVVVGFGVVRNLPLGR